MSDATVAALGKLSEALEIVDNARGHLYAFHQLSGSADLALQDAVRQFRDAGQHDWADQARRLVGRDVIDDKWSFELVEAYDTQYWQVFRDTERDIRRRAGNAPVHIFEAEMKHREQHDHRPATEPPTGGDQLEHDAHPSIRR